VSAAALETGLFLSGLRCAGCVGRVEQALEAAPGVLEASVNYTTHRALVRFDPDRTDAKALVLAVARLGYEARPYDPCLLQRSGERESREALVRVLVAAFLAMNVMLVATALYIGGHQDLDPITRRGLRWLAIALSIPSVTWCAAPFWRGAFSGLRRGLVTMDVPVVLGVATSFGVMIAGTLVESQHLFVDSAALIVFLILLGRTLERRARARAAGAVEQLAALVPEEALRWNGSAFEPVAIDALAPGDRVRVPVGQAVPVDGRILSGDTELDEALLTGESLPVRRRVGEPVAGGSRNLVAELEIEVTAAVHSGTVARLAALLERAQASKPPVQQLADRVAGWFAPTVLLLAGLTALGWIWSGAPWLDAALASAAVLIVACPCALGLATPAAITAAIGRAARLGILIQKGAVLETCARVDLALLDKTGTLTEGRFRVVEAIPARGVARSRLLGCAASAEGASTHPIAGALVEAAGECGAAVDERAPRVTHPGLGVEAGEGGARLLVGARRLLAANAVEISAELDEAAAKRAERGLALAWVAEGREALGVVAIADTPRADAAQAVERLQRAGLDIELLTGDHEHAARLAAERTGIREVRARVSPERKLAELDARREEGRRVLFVGDGINDAAALAAADVGVAMGAGADVALHAADAVIRAPRLGAVADLVGLARATLARIRENLAFALLYNAVAVPLAAIGVLEPLHAAIAMSFSSVAVTLNAIRLLKWTPEA